MDGDPYIIVRGGLVVNDPALPVLDLDVLDGSFIDENDVASAEELRSLASDLGLTEIVSEIDAWIVRERERLTEAAR